MTESTFLWLDSTAWTAITALATTVLVIVGGLTIISAGIDSRAKARPYVVAEIRLGKHAERMNLVITNYGVSAARNVRVELPEKFRTLGPWADELSGNTKQAMLWLKSKYEAPMPILGPGQAETNTWIYKAEVIDRTRFSPDLQEEIVISYDKPGLFSGIFPKRYRDVFLVSFDARKYDTWNSSSLDLDQQMKKVITNLGTIGEAIRSVTDTIEEAQKPAISVADSETE